MAGAAGAIIFQNDSGRQILLFKNEVMVKELAPESVSREDTALGDHWIIKDKASNMVMGEIYGAAGEQTFIVQVPRGLPPKSGSSGGGD